MPRRPLAVTFLIGLAPLLIRAILLPVFPAPEPRVHDEFSHLLAADTFAHGRLANPPHPMWVHFESMHTIVQPVYASIFPVAQGLVLAAAQGLTGWPWIGVWLSVGAMCAAIHWMLRGWVPPGWALLGAAIAAARYGVFSYWMNSYYGGAIPAIGGALALGALPRIVKKGHARDAVILAIGVAILANSRPYEGAIFAVPLALALLTGLRGKVRVLIPSAAILALTAAGMMFYFHRITGNPLRLPYSFYRETKTQAPHFIWQSARAAPVYYHRVTKQFYGNSEIVAYRSARGNRSPYGLWDKTKDYGRFFIGPFLALAFITAPWMWRNRRTRWLTIAAAFVAIGLAVEVWHSPHYAAPATGLAMLISIQALRQVKLWKHGRLAVALLAIGSAATPVPPPAANGIARAQVLAGLRAAIEPQLAIVRYRPDHDPGDEWVYNDANIDGAKVVWAREMDPAGNRALLAYFHNREAWLVEPDAMPPRVTPYRHASPPDPPFGFVPLGTASIEVLRSPSEVKRQVAAMASAASLTCDQWNYYFTEVTGVEGPPTPGCYAQSLADLVTIDRWFDWLLRQR